jgi:DNA-binding GntR family transcriptional regulator
MSSAVAASPSLRVRAYESFQRQIIDAQLRPGQFVSQRELVQLLGMPLGAVRELIPRLEAEGLLRTVPQRGLQIAHVDLALINNAFQLRQVLEREAVARFCHSVSDADLATIEDAHRRIVRRAKHGPIDAALLTDAQAVDWGLHDLMIDALGNALISETYRVNSLRLRLIWLERTILSEDTLADAMQEHLWFIDALKRRDETLAVRRLAHHLDCAHKSVLGLPRPPLDSDEEPAHGR